jgi:hypothetical protein
MVDSIQSSRLSSATSSTVRLTSLQADPLVKLTPASLHEEKSTENISISEEAKSKVSSEAETLKYLRKIQAQASLPNERLAELKVQFQSPEGLSAYLDSLDSERLAQSLLDQKII